MTDISLAPAGINRLEQLARQDSPIHRLNPMSKLITTALYIAAVLSFTSQNVSGLIPFCIFPAVLMPLSGTPYRPLLKRLLLALPFSLAVGIGNLLFDRGTAFYIGSLAVSSGAVSFASIMLKTLMTVFSVLILIATTSFVDLSCMFAALHVPKVLCLQLILTYRYISVLLGEAVSMFTAYSLRSPMQKGIKIKDFGSFLGGLILRSFDRAERVYLAMKCRGFDGVYFGEKPDKLKPRDLLYIVFLSLAMAVLRFYNISVLLGKLAL